MKKFLTLTLIAGLVASSKAALIISGVIDGDLSGGTPKAIVLQATANIADLSTWGVGSANNGSGSSGVETGLSGSITSGQYIIVSSNSDSADFFTNNFATSNFIAFTGAASNINGDDAIELFNNGSVVDTYGDINTDGSGETWEYLDGYAVRIGGTAGAFNQANYSSNNGALDTLNETQQATTLGGAFNNFSSIPEPGFASLAALGALALVRRRR